MTYYDNFDQFMKHEILPLIKKDLKNPRITASGVLVHPKKYNVLKKMSIEDARIEAAKYGLYILPTME